MSAPNLVRMIFAVAYLPIALLFVAFDNPAAGMGALAISTVFQQSWQLNRRLDRQIGPEL